MSLVASQHRLRLCGITCAALATTALTLGPAPTRGAEPPTTPPVALPAADARPQFWFGVAVENIPQAFAEQLKLRQDQGVMVVGVFPNSPAARAGIQPKDLLIEINGTPLTSQEDLATAANRAGTVKVGASKGPVALMPASNVVFLRKGDRMTAQLTPDLRPVNMLVSGANSEQFSLGDGSVAAAVPQVRNMVLSNSINVQYGPGYKVEANAGGNLTVLRQAVEPGQSLIITEESDSAGNTQKITIRDGSKTYSAEPGKLDQVPANIRPLVERRLAQVKPQTSPGAAAVEMATSTDDRLQRLELQNEELKQQLEEVKALLLKASQSGTQK